jgi:hypothetical protein
MKHISMEYHKLGERTPRVMADGNATAVDYARNLSQKSKNIYPDHGINKDSSKKLYQIGKRVWSTNSRDLSPIEQLWDTMGRKVNNLH